MVKVILSIEDDSVTQMLNKIELQDGQVCERLDEAWNGEVAIKYYEALSKEKDGQSRIPEIILLDLNMPVMDGWEFLEIFKNRFPEFAQKTKIFILSSSINPSDREKAKSESIVVDFLSKPLDEFELKAIKKASLE